MAGLNHRPIVFPLSNPVSLSECTYNEALEWSQGTVIFASGSPFPDVKYDGAHRYPGQGNNMYVFPGLGLGAILSRASAVTDSMVEAASLALADSLTDEERAEDRVYPNLTRIREISAQIAHRVVRTAQNDVRSVLFFRRLYRS
jgi:malate dehydrogenase (oxaloacetate-decarboxylating)(NADP+)